MTLGDELRTLRQLRGWTLRQVEEKYGVSNGYLNLLERDKIKKPSPHVLHKLAKAYDTPYPRLMELAGYISPKEDSKDETRRTKTSLGIALKSIDDLSKEEIKEVAEFVKFIRAKRPKGKKLKGEGTE